MEFRFTDSDYNMIINQVFFEFLSLKDHSNNFDIIDSKKKEHKEVLDDEKYDKSSVIDNLSVSYLDNIFNNNNIIVNFQKRINIFFNKLIVRYMKYINDLSIIEEKKLENLKLDPIKINDIIFVWKGSTSMKTLYNKYKDLLDPEVDKRYREYFYKKSDADYGVFINPKHKDAEFHRNNMIKLSFLLLVWLRDSIDLEQIDNIINKIKFDIDYRLIHANLNLYTGPLKEIETQTWTFKKKIRKDHMFYPIINEVNNKYLFTRLNLKDEVYTEDSTEKTTYYKNEGKEFYLSLHDKILINNTMCDNNKFKKNFSLLKLKYDIICTGNIKFKDGEIKTVNYLLSNEIIDLAFRTIDDVSMLMDYQNITDIIKPYNKIIKNVKFNIKEFTFNSYTLDGFIIDFNYNLFKTSMGNKGYITWLVPKYRNNINRLFYFLLLKLLYIKEEAYNELINKKTNKINNELHEIVSKLIYTMNINTTAVYKINIKSLDFFIQNIRDIKLYPKPYPSDMVKFFNLLNDNLKFIINILNKQNNLLNFADNDIVNLQKYLKYKEKYLKLKEQFGGAIYTPSFPHFSLFIKSDITNMDLVDFLKNKTNILVSDSSRCCYVPNHSQDYKYHISLVRLYINISHPNYNIITNTNWVQIQHLINTATTKLMNSMEISINEINTIGENKSFIAVYFKSNINKNNYNDFIKDIIQIFSNNKNIEIIHNTKDKLINVHVNHTLFACFEDYYYEPNHITVAQSDETKESLQGLSLLVRQYNTNDMCKYIVKKYNMNTNMSNVQIKKGTNIRSTNQNPYPSEIVNKNNYL